MILELVQKPELENVGNWEGSWENITEFVLLRSALDDFC